VLLRAVRIEVDVQCASPGAYRMLFRKLKFLRLLHSIRPRARGGYHIEIDGPFNLFESSTKYGLQLAMALPAIRECDSFELKADLRWGTQRTPLSFALSGGRGGHDAVEARLPDEIDALIGSVAEAGTPWQAAPADAVLDLPGVGVCVPDLVFTHGETGECVYLEVLGYWSRAAVWKRVELVEQGLGERIVFAVGKQLRVSEEVLDEDLPGALYVYKRTMTAKAVLERVEAVARARIAIAPSSSAAVVEDIDDDGPGEDLFKDCPPAPRSRPRPKAKRRTADPDR
jgi:predicted nuclease of restriction endonuclease-like RecB superfamily